MDQLLCGNCRYWQSLDAAKDRGECRRHAPRLAEPPSPYEKHPLRVWPSTMAHDWCGEHAPRADMAD